MRAVSSKQSKRNREISKIKKCLPAYCVICGKIGVDAAHLLPKSIYPEYYTLPANIVSLCRKCHQLYDDDREFRSKQENLRLRVEKFDKQAAYRHFEK